MIFDQKIIKIHSIFIFFQKLSKTEFYPINFSFFVIYFWKINLFLEIESSKNRRVTKI